MQNANTLEAMEVARQLILVLKGTVESLQMNLSQERDDNEGLKLTIESLEDENARLQEELFKVQAGAVNGEIRKHGFNQRFHKYKRHCESCSAAFLMEWANPEV